MSHQPSWKWLPRRSSCCQGTFAAVRSARPCLPQVETLGDRIMLSAVPASAEGGVTSTDVLITMLKGQLPVVNDELNVLNSAGKLTLADGSLKVTFMKLSDALGQLDDAIYGLGDAIIKSADKVSPGEIVITKDIDQATAKLLEAQGKVDVLAKVFGLDAETDFALAYNNLEADSKVLTDQLFDFAAKFVTGTTDQQHENFLLELSDDFQQIDQDLIKIGTDLAVTDKIVKGEVEYLKIKLNDVLITSAKTGDDGLQQLAGDLAKQTIDLIFGDDTLT